jgi:hypothetical protein
MKMQILVLALGLTVGFQALAMPNFDGRYSCKARQNGNTLTVNMTTRNNTLFLEGLNMDAANKGIPCSNETSDASVNDISMHMVTTCNDSKLTAHVETKQTSTNTDLTVDIGVELISADKTNLAIGLSGTVNGQQVPPNTKIDIDCAKF